jgi:hypothetical protein
MVVVFIGEKCRKHLARGQRYSPSARIADSSFQKSRHLFLPVHHETLSVAAAVKRGRARRPGVPGHWWQVDNSPTPQGRVKILLQENLSITHQSDANFTVQRP